MSIVYGAALSKARRAIFEAVVLGVGKSLPGCLVCITVSNHGVDVCLSQYTLAAMGKTIGNATRRIFKNLRDPVSRVTRPTRRMVVDVNALRVGLSRSIAKIFDIENFYQMHTYLLYFDTHHLLYRAYNEDFPLPKAMIERLTFDIFKAWTEMRASNIDRGEYLYSYVERKWDGHASWATVPELPPSLARQTY